MLNPLTLVRELSGSELKVLILLWALIPHRVNQAYLQRHTGLTDKTVAEALKYLAEMQYINKTSAGWQITSGAVQLPLMVQELEEGHAETRLVEDDRGRGEDSLTPAPSLRSGQAPLPGGEGEEVIHRVSTDGADFTDSENKSRNNSDSESLEEDSLSSSLEDSSSDSLNYPGEVGKIPTAKILEAACELFGARIAGRVEDYGDARLLLGWIAHAWRHRKRDGNEDRKAARSPAGLVYWAFHKGKGQSAPDPCYLRDPLPYLPTDFIAALGIDVTEVINCPICGGEPCSCR